MDCQKHLFSLPDDHYYINCSYLSPLLKSVEEAGISGIREKRRPWETLPRHFFEDSNTLRTLFADLINAENHSDIAIMPSVSYGMATVARNLDPGRGSDILVAGEQFPSNVYPWKRFCNTHGCNLEFIAPPQATVSRGRIWNETILNSIDDDTLMVALGNVHWADGTLFDLETIGEKARRHDAYLVIDGTQSVGALPFDVKTIKPDALVCAGYKWLMGPYAISLGYFAPSLQKGIPLEEGWIARKNSENFSGLVAYEREYQPGSIRFDMGEHSNFILVPMMIVALRQILEWKPERIQTYCSNLTRELVSELPKSGYQIEDPKWRGHHMFGIRLPRQVSRKQLEQRFKEQKIHVSIRGSAVRISPNVYNDERDISVLLKVLQNLAE